MKTLRQHLLSGVSAPALTSAQGKVDHAQVHRALTLAGLRLGFLRVVKTKAGFRVEDAKAR